MNFIEKPVAQAETYYGTPFLLKRGIYQPHQKWLKYDGYIYINEMGYRMNPEFLSRNFKQALEDNGLRQIRFHDLRHSSASLLLANHVPLKQIQEWLGHSDFSTTANIYAHLDAEAKKNTAAAMLRGLGFGQTEDSNL